ncbi:hypothetical protein BDY19DRAFT_998868 [Irpex rosettiformis]|uniref:Uncharacterized protein n=1 Tax=Irpex rosettiformis TaxID=378272 RepID=A0ACB8TM35_9APHY|nr:hypothetical protein BDY19DRAFT_998868 [Irpex rosettiformis]
MDKRVERSFARGTAEQIQRWTALREKHCALEVPTRESNPLVFFWNSDGVRTLVGQKHWQEKFDSSGKSQRRYNPVTNQWDICPFLDPDFRLEHSDDEDEDNDVYWGAQKYASELAARMDMDIGLDSPAAATTSRVVVRSPTSAAARRFFFSRLALSPYTGASDIAASPVATIYNYTPSSFSWFLIAPSSNSFSYSINLWPFRPFD